MNFERKDQMLKCPIWKQNLSVCSRNKKFEFIASFFHVGKYLNYELRHVIVSLDSVEAL